MQGALEIAKKCDSKGSRTKGALSRQIIKQLTICSCSHKSGQTPRDRGRNTSRILAEAFENGSRGREIFRYDAIKEKRREK